MIQTLRRLFFNAFDLLLLVLGIAALFMLLTGGHTFSIPYHGRIIRLEASEVDGWFIALGLLFMIFTYVHRFVTKKWRRPLAWRAFSGFIEKVQTPMSNRTWFGIVSITSFFVFWVAHVMRHWSFHTNACDLTAVHQALIRAFELPLLRCDLCTNGSFLGEHLAFSFFLISPLVKIFELFSPEAVDEFIFFLQSALVLFTLFFVIRNELKLPKALEYKRNLAVIALLISLSSRALRQGLVWDFREDVMAFAFLMIAIYGLRFKRFGIYFSCLILALLTKENLGLVTIFLSVPILFSKPLGFSKSLRLRLVAATVAISLVYVWLSFTFLIPYFSGNLTGQNNISLRLQVFGSSPGQIITSIASMFFSNPLALIRTISPTVMTFESAKYLVLLFGPFAYVLIKGSVTVWPWVVVTIPGIAMNLVSTMSTQRSLQFHYDWIIIPFLIYPMILGLSSLRRSQIVIAVFIAICFSGRWPGYFIQQYWPTSAEISDVWYLRSLQSQGPGPVAASYSTLGQMSQVYEIRQLFLNMDGTSEPTKSFSGDGESASLTESEFKMMQDRTWSKISGQTAYHASFFVIDRSEMAARTLENYFFQNHFNEKSVSPTGRFTLFSRF